MLPTPSCCTRPALERLALLGIFGTQTTSFVALLAGLGLAIGTAWGGLLAHSSLVVRSTRRYGSVLKF